MELMTLISDQFAHDIAMQARAANQAFVATMAGNVSIHSRCAQVIDKRIAEFDLEEARAQSSIDPVSQSYMLTKASQESGSTQVSNALLLEVLRQAQVK